MFNLNNLFSKPATPVLTLDKPTAKHPRELSRFGPFDVYRVSSFIISMASTTPPPPLIGQFDLILVPC